MGLNWRFIIANTSSYSISMVSKAGYYFYPNIKLTSNDYNLYVLMLWLHAEHKIWKPQNNIHSLLAGKR